jgi:NAD+ synthetase
MKIALAQLNPTVGDIAGNRRLVQEAAEKATAEGADLVVLPEMVLTGYPPMDLLERDGFVNAQLEALEELAEASRDIAIVLGAVTRMPEGRPEALANSAVLLSGGQQVAVQPKSLLPTYDVFDEKRYFVPGDSWAPADLPGGGERLGLAVCEDTWTERIPYSVVPVQELASRGASIIINPSASPWHAGKPAERREMFEELVRHHGLPLVFVNQVGGNDELIFDGGSFVMNASGRIIAQMPLFETGLMVVDLDSADEAPGQPMAEEPGRIAQLEAGLVLGIRDYFLKQNLPPGAVIGLSGGIDSAVTAHLAVEALGPERVVGIAMPGPFSSEHSITDAVALAEMLEIELRTAEIEPMYAAYRGVFGSLFGKREDYGLTQQNIQSRIRGAILMAVSNEENRLVLATGNKSELSLGYCTLYGDTVGGLAVLGDVYKHDVYALARYANRAAQRIPTGSLEKPPSAELAPDQIDTNDLPDYDIVDAVLEQAIEGGRNSETIVPPDGCSREVALSVVRRLDRNEYKRRQTPLVLRTTPKAFGSGRRLPIVHRFG